MLADLFDRAGMTHAIGNALSDPALDVEALGNMTSVKLFGKFYRH